MTEEITGESSHASDPWPSPCRIPSTISAPKPQAASRRERTPALSGIDGNTIKADVADKPWDRRSRLPSVILSLAAAATVILSTSRYGAGLWPDSVNYVSAARSFAAGKGLIGYDGVPLVRFAPLYPVLLGSISRATGLDPLSYAHVVNAVLLAAIVCLSGFLLSRYVTFSPALAFVGTVAVLIVGPLVDVSVMAGSEPLFILCVLLFFVSARGYTMGASTISLIAVTLSAAAASLIRYVGIVIIPVGVLLILFRRETQLKPRILHLFGFLVTSAGSFGVWVTRNYLLTGTLLGPRHGSASTVIENYHRVLVNVLSWFVGALDGRLGLIRYVSAVVLASVPIAAVFALLRGRGITGLLARGDAAVRKVGLLLLFIVLYATFLIVSSTTTAYDAINDRLLSPIHAPVIVLLFVILDRSIGLLRAAPVGRYSRIGLLAVVAIWLLSPALTVARSSLDRARRGAGGYSTVTWRESPTIDFVERLAPGERDVIYSDDPWAIRILTHRTASLSPERVFYRSSEAANDISDFVGSWPEGGHGLLVWFGRTGKEWLFTPPDLQTIADFDTLAELDDGTIYSVRARSPTSNRD